MENKQFEVQDSQQNVIGQYRYNGDGKRIKKIVPATDEVTVFVYNASGQLVAEYSTEISQAPKVSYTTADHLGSPRILTDENGATISRRDFHPFGEEVFTSQRTHGLGYQPDDVRQKFTGYEKDDETGLDFAQARMYRSNLGRFSGPDDILKDSVANDPQSWNKYIYVRNNPLNLVDPSGEKAEVTITTDKKNKTGTILIKASFGIYAQDGKYTKKELEQQGALLKAQIEETYKGGFIKDGITYTVSASVTTQVYESEDAAVAAGTSGEVDNIVGLRNASSFQGNFGNGRTTRYSGYGYNVAGDNFDRMVIATGSKELHRSTLYAHEFGHVMGDIGHLPDGLKEGLMRQGGGTPPKIAGRYLTSQDFDLILARPIANHITGTGGPFAQEPRPIRPAIRMNLYPRSTTREVVRAATVNVWFSR